MTKILHVTADFPDVFVKNKTTAVKNLVNGCVFESFVVSINRKNIPGKTEFVRDGNVLSVKYFSPPLGILNIFFLRKLAGEICNFIDCRSFDIVHAHKLCVEGVIADVICENSKAKLVCSLWGSTDHKFLSKLKWNRPVYRRLIEKAALVLPASPWISEYAYNIFGLKMRNVHLLPIVTENIKHTFSSDCNDRMVTVFNLDLFELKGLENLLRAIKLFGDESPALDIFGGGTEDSVNKISRLIHSLELEDKVFLKGRVENADIVEILSQYLFFVMPTRSETFGMVYIEALFANIPIVYSRDRGVSGYFDEVLVGSSCDPLSIESIRDALSFCMKNNSRIRFDINRLHLDGFFSKFTRDSILYGYNSLLGAL
ncbi:glycosyltransferase family 4 protein [Vogesella sp. DC21W]|uniref:Glycosyltransferase family 4 protein n=1 Tax=Vogesella aquatica TaxID=2984206 RepID=A0ABT5IU97_9NEIS|nr:glycosyltransferase family 4 protein [Vogesella aquatica]MDC7716137.1 glycosyltransferase family 4 protein [Vogesella aquatica]